MFRMNLQIDLKKTKGLVGRKGLFNGFQRIIQTDKSLKVREMEPVLDSFS